MARSEREGAQALQQLQQVTEVHFVGSGVSDEGVFALLGAPLPRLVLLNAASCTHVTHASVTRAAARPVTVQRLPSWFAQRWVCVRHRSIQVGEVHEYHLDGTFQFTRAAQNSGNVLGFTPVGSSHFELSVQYDDEEALAQFGLPGWRPCVCVKLCADGREMRTAQRTSIMDSSCPASIPDEDEPGVCTGHWRLEEADTPRAL